MNRAEDISKEIIIWGEPAGYLRTDQGLYDVDVSPEAVYPFVFLDAIHCDGIYAAHAHPSSRNTDG